MYKQIFKQIKKYNTIVIARHIGIDPDAMASEVALRDAIKLTFPEKEVYAIGAGTVRFNYMGKLDKGVTLEDKNDVLLIVVDTPDKRRVDFGDFNNYSYSIKIDHHPHIETFCDLELIDDTKSSASEMVYDLIKNTKLIMNQDIAKTLFCGMVADTNRFLFNNSSYKTFNVVSELVRDYKFDITECYANLYRRPFSEMQLLSYMTNNMKITENGVGCTKIDNSVIVKYQLDSVSGGDLINEFNHVDELLVWVTATEDIKNSCIRVSIRSRGPVINKVAEKYNGGGHKLASGARLPSYEEVDSLVKDLDLVCKKYIESGVFDED